jgi:hypothetical protein
MMRKEELAVMRIMEDTAERWTQTVLGVPLYDDEWNDCLLKTAGMKAAKRGE